MEVALIFRKAKAREILTAPKSYFPIEPSFRDHDNEAVILRATQEARIHIPPTLVLFIEW